MHIALMNQFYPPTRAPTGKLLSDLAAALRNRGHRVTVITSAGLYGAGSQDPFQDAEGIDIVRLGQGGLHRTGILSKLLDYAGFFLRAYRALAQLYPAPDLVVSMTTPPFCGLIAARLKKKKNIPFVLWCMDLYPEALAASGMMKENGFLYRILGNLTCRERNEARSIITLGPDMTRRVRAAVPSADICEIPVWSHLESTPEVQRAAQALRRERGWAEDETILLYSGNMGRAHCADPFAALAGCVDSKIRFIFCGSGPSKADWRQKYRDRFEWIDPVDEEELAAHLLSADVHLISQHPDWAGVVVPSKYQAACALGRPVLFAGPPESAVAQWIHESGAGWILSSSSEPDVKKTAEEISDSVQVAATAGNTSNELFVRKILLGRLAGQIEQAAKLP